MHSDHLLAAAPLVAATYFLEAKDGAQVALHRLGGAPPGAPVLLWGHANGFAAGCYAALLRLLAAEFDVWAWDARGQGEAYLPPNAALGLDAIAGDAALAVQAVRRVIGQVPHVASHSFAGVALLWATVTLGLEWRSATLFEPPLVMPEQLHDLEAAARHAARVSGTLKRRQDWASPEEFASRLAESASFVLVPHGSLAVHARAVLRPRTGGGFTLRCAPATEAAIYRTVWDAAPFQALRPFGRPMRFVASDATPPAPPSPSRLVQRPAAVACGRLMRNWRERAI